MKISIKPPATPRTRSGGDVMLTDFEIELGVLVLHGTAFDFRSGATAKTWQTDGRCTDGLQLWDIATADPEFVRALAQTGPNLAEQKRTQVARDAQARGVRPMPDWKETDFD